MKNILVVDDSAVDRRLIGGLLAADAGLAIRYAEDGAEALKQIDRDPPDLVVTDLQMPNMGGLSLIEAIRGSHSLVPVIIVTSQGSEELAVEALRRGASSYVPKSSLARDLLSVVHNILAVSGRKRDRSRMLGSMTASTCEFIFDNDSALFSALIGHVQDNAGAMALCDELEKVRIGIALEEALSNALHHGNLEVDSQLREKDYREFYSLIRQRCEQSPYMDRRIRVTSTISKDQARITIRDEGAGFDPTALPDPTDPEDLEKASGRGVLLMRTFMDEVIYNDAGNEVVLVKRASPGAALDA